MLEQLLNGFATSEQGKSAMAVLAEKGLSKDVISQVLGAAVPAATGALQKQAGGSPSEPELGLFDVLGGHPGQAFLIGAMTSVLRGEGFTEAAKDGAVGVVGAHVTEVIASRVGLDRQLAAWVGAAISPFLVSYAYEKLSGEPSVQTKRGQPLTQQDVQRILTEKRAANMKRVLANPSSPEAQKIVAEQRSKIAATAEHRTIQAAIASGTAVPPKSAPAKNAPVAGAAPAKPLPGKPVAGKGK